MERAISLSLADGSRWSVISVDPRAFNVVSHLKEAMQLHCQNDPASRLFVLVDDHKADSDAGTGYHNIPDAHANLNNNGIQWSPFPSVNDNDQKCILNSNYEGDLLLGQLLDLSQVFTRHSETLGGLEIHGALAEWEGNGVILAGPSDVGKTTASMRFKAPWRSLSDDATLVVRDEEGAYWAHPWPTWSKFMSGGSGGTWDVERAVPLKGIFFLVQEQEDWVELVRDAQAVCLLVETAEMSSWLFSEDIGGDEARAKRIERFDKICILAKSVPCYLLHLSLVGTFWNEIERVIDNN